MKEPKTVFGKIIAALLSVFISNWPSFVAKLWKKVPDDLQDKFMIGIKVVEALKRVVDSPVVDLVTAIIPGDVDDKIKDKLRELINRVLDDYDWEDMSSENSHLIATKINQELTGLPFGQSALTTEVAYQNYKGQTT